MNRKWKLALAALLGFSAACSTVKQAPQKTEEAPRSGASSSEVAQRPGGASPAAADTTQHLPPRIVLMYGVRSPVSDSIRNRRLERQRPDSLPPVAEQPVEEDPAAE